MKEHLDPLLETGIPLGVATRALASVQKTRACIVPVNDVSARQRAEMLALLDRYYAGVTRDQFERDLAEKEWVVLLTGSVSGDIRGFSTLMQLRTTVDREPVVALYSGDTVTDSDYWGEATTAGIGVLLRHMYDVAARSEGARCFWFMISSTYKSYRLLPLLFRRFHPAPDQPVPDDVARCLTALMRLKFSTEYDAGRSIVRFANPTLPRPSLSPLSTRSVRDPYIEFFLSTNHGHAQGERLATLTELTVDNLTPLGRRLYQQNERGA